MIFNRILVRLLIAALVLPVAICVFMASAHLLQAMGDAMWAYILQRVAVVAGVIWAVDLVSLLLAVAIYMIVNMGRSDRPLDE